MKEYENLSLSDFKSESQAKFEPMHNTTRILSHEGELHFTANEIYWFYTNKAEMTVYKPWSIEISEIASYRRTGLAGYRITLKDGKELNFSNVFRKMRNGITEEIEKRMH